MKQYEVRQSQTTTGIYRVYERYYFFFWVQVAYFYNDGDAAAVEQEARACVKKYKVCFDM
jgi:hypothetical protein